MKQATIMLVVFGVLVVGNSSAWAENENPFGFETDKHPLEYEYCKRDPGLINFRGHGYTCSWAPRPHPDIQEYQLQFVKDVGLCVIVASTQPSTAYTHAGHGEAFISDYETQIANQLAEFLNEIGFEWDNEDTEQLAHILGAYIDLSPRYSQRHSSAKTPREEVAVLNDAFQELQKRWPVTDPSNALIQWEKQLKRLVEEDVRSDSRNMFEAFKRQLTNKYGLSSVPEETAALEQNLRQMIKHKSSGDIITDTRKEVLARYNGGYRWEPAQGFERAGDIRSISLVLNSEGFLLETVSHRVTVSFGLVTADTCWEKIDDKADGAF